METFGARLRRMREDRGFGLNEFAALIGKSNGYVSRVERGQRLAEKLPNYDDLRVMARVLDVPVDALAGDEIAAPPLPPPSDAALMLRFGAEVVPPEEAEPALEDFAASALHGRGNLIPQNYDDMRPKPRPKGKRQPKPEPTTFKLRVSGDCLAPRFLDEPHTIGDGEIAWFDTRLEREPVCLVFAVKDDHEGHIKRLVERDGTPWLESNDGWSTPVDEHWRLVARAFTAQRRLL